jgi:hypothetical protein
MCDGIESVPYHKVFSFGGKKGMMQYMNTVEVMDCGSQVHGKGAEEGAGCHSRNCSHVCSQPHGWS